MSKFLKFIVNLFLILSILTAAAILVPPLVGIRTTIVDSPYIETNLPMGSVTYSRDIYVTSVAQGDRVLKEDDTSSYVYVVERTDTSTGNFTVRDAENTSAEPQTIQILNSIPKVVVTIPVIGYVVYAMRSIEGLIILSLVVLLMIILFILSELWRNDDDDDEEEEEEEDDDLSIPETEAYDLQRVVDIRPYMDKQMEITTGHTADLVSAPLPRINDGPEKVKAESAPLPVIDETVTEELVSEEDLAAATQTEEEKREAQMPSEPVPVINVPEEAAAEEADEAVETVEETAEETAGSEEAPEEGPAEEVFEEAAEDGAEEAGPAPEESTVAGEEAESSEETVPGEVYAAAAATAAVAAAAVKEQETAEEEPAAQETAVRETVPEEAQPAKESGQSDSDFDMDRLEQGLEAALHAPQEEEKEEPAQEEPEILAEPSAESVLKAGTTGEITETLAEIAASAGATGPIAAETAEEIFPKEESFLEEADEPDPDTDSFIPVSRPTLEELLKDVSEYGVEAEVRKDNVTGISVVDYSNII